VTFGLTRASVVVSGLGRGVWGCTSTWDMPVVLDPSGERHRALSSASALWVTEELEDWPQDAVRNAEDILERTWWVHLVR
jgi:hypothetical protein